MPKLLSRYLLLSFSFISLVSKADGNWYEIGTLHDSDIASWKSASPENKLATASDWVLTNPKVLATVQSSGTIETNKPFAQKLVLCIDESIKGKRVTGLVRVTAAYCMALEILQDVYNELKIERLELKPQSQ